jgi:tetratricopeptide (TPR) repeat protein
MKRQIVLLALLFPTLFLSSSRAHVLLDGRVNRAAILNDAGHFRDAILLLEPIVHATPIQLDDADIAVAWSVLGFSYDNAGQFEKARYAYAEAVRLLQRIPMLKAQYASTLDNLAMLDFETGNLADATSTSRQASRVHRSQRDHTGSAHSAGTLALIEMTQGNTKQADKEINSGLREAFRAVPEDVSEVANLMQIEGSLDARLGRNGDALAAIDKAISIWITQFGEGYYLLASAFGERGQIYTTLGDFPRAKADFERSLSLFRRTDQWTAPSRHVIQLAYARELHAAGDDRASRTLQNEANTDLTP